MTFIRALRAATTTSHAFGSDGVATISTNEATALADRLEAAPSAANVSRALAILATPTAFASPEARAALALGVRNVRGSGADVASATWDEDSETVRIRTSTGRNFRFDGDHLTGMSGITTVGDGRYAIWLSNEGSISIGGRQPTAEDWEEDDMAMGYENEGMGLHIFDARTGTARRIWGADVIIDRVEEVYTARGELMLAVSLSDGGLGLSRFALVNPRTGETVFSRDNLSVNHIKNGVVVFDALVDPQESDAENPKTIFEAARLDATTGAFTERVHTVTFAEIHAEHQAEEPDDE